MNTYSEVKNNFKVLLKVWELIKEGYNKIELSTFYGITAYKLDKDGVEVLDMLEIPELKFEEVKHDASKKDN